LKFDVGRSMFSFLPVPQTVSTYHDL
jgi:hypothetical protein